MSEVSSGVTRDHRIIIDPSGPTSQMEKMTRLKKAVQEVDKAWYDSNEAYLVSSLSFQTFYLP